MDRISGKVQWNRCGHIASKQGPHTDVGIPIPQQSNFPGSTSLMWTAGLDD